MTQNRNRLLIVEHCLMCSHAECDIDGAGEFMCICRHADNRRLPDNWRIIPEWCPLPFADSGGDGDE